MSLTLGKFPEPDPCLIHSRCLINACTTAEGDETAFWAEVKVELSSGPKMTTEFPLNWPKSPVQCPTLVLMAKFTVIP